MRCPSCSSIRHKVLETSRREGSPTLRVLSCDEGHRFRTVQFAGSPAFLDRRSKPRVGRPKSAAPRHSGAQRWTTPTISATAVGIAAFFEAIGGEAYATAAGGR